MKRFCLIFVVLLVFLAVASGAEVRRGGLGAWRPTLNAEIDTTEIPLGDTYHISYKAGGGATSCQRDITVWEPRTNGTIIPLEGVISVTPTEVGESVTTITAFKRARDLNLDGRADGPRRSVTLTFRVDVRGDLEKSAAPMPTRFRRLFMRRGN